MNYLASARPTAVNIKIAAEELIGLINKLTEDDTVTVQQMKEQCVDCLPTTYPLRDNIFFYFYLKLFKKKKVIDTQRSMYYRFLHTIDSMLQRDIADNKAIGNYGALEILKNVNEDSLVRILTHCNTGSLATAGYGTALGVIRSLQARNVLGEFLFIRRVPCYQEEILSV